MNSGSNYRMEKAPPRQVEPDVMAPAKKRVKQDDGIKVYCRIRPIEAEEEASSGISIVEGEHTMVLLNEDSSRPISKKYTFTELFKDEKQDEVIRKLCDPLLQSIDPSESESARSKGGLIFTYGVTNSGKTHTVLGTDDEPGILQYLFQRIPKPFSLLPVEVYNDEFFPLVSPRTRIHLVECSGVMEFKDYSPLVITNENVEEVLRQIKSNRSQKSTVHNSKSSRSHAIFRLEVGGKVLGVVDLAGSERIREGCTHQETTNINRSLLTLGRCLTCMRESRHDRSVQIPFRESRLTLALSEYFAIGHRLTMVVNINPARSMINETVNVLEYAAIARDIKPVTPTKSRYRNINSSHNKMLVTLEETKSEGDFDIGFKKATPMLKRFESVKKEEPTEPSEEQKQQCISQLREYLIQNNVSLMKSSYYEKHKLMNEEFHSYFEREVQQDEATDHMFLRSIHTSVNKGSLHSQLEKEHHTAAVSFQDAGQGREEPANPNPNPNNPPPAEISDIVREPQPIKEVPAEAQTHHIPKHLADAVVVVMSPQLATSPQIQECADDKMPPSPIMGVKEESQVEPQPVLCGVHESVEVEPNHYRFQTDVKEKRGLFERLVVSPYQSLKKGVKRIWDKLSPAKYKGPEVSDASQLVLHKNGKLMSRKSSLKNGRCSYAEKPLSPHAQPDSVKQNSAMRSNQLASENESHLPYPDFDDIVLPPKCERPIIQ